MEQSLNFAEARHLVARTGLGAEWKLIKKLEGRTRQQAVNIVLHPQVYNPPAPPKMTAWHIRMNMHESKNPRHKMKMHAMTTLEGRRLKRWWIAHMRRTPSPLVEKLTLFWHGHFTSSLDKIEQPSLLYKQHMLLRRHALGSFSTLLKGVAKDPAMLVYLDGMLNEKRHPNENFARELLELFTLGHGYYSEHDVKNVARAFTGWSVDRYQERFAFNKEEHDNAPKKVLGKWVKNGDDVIRVLLQHPRTARTIAEKFWSLFINDAEPDSRTIQSWANTFRHSRYNIRTLLGSVFNSDAFWSEENRGALTKSPADLVVGSLRMVPWRTASMFSDKDVEGIFRLLGQDLFDPANVKGWKTGMDWIDAETVMVRSSMINKLTGGNMNARVNKGAGYPDAPPEQYQQWLLAQQPVSSLPETPGKARLVRALALDPVYQLT